MKAVTPIPFVRAKFTDKCGKPLVGGKIYTYESNTTTPKVTYKDPYGMTPNTNPIILDIAGEADIYLHGTYRIIVKDRRDAVINDVSKLGSWFSATLDDTLNDISMAFNNTIQPIINNAEKSFIAIEQNLNNEKNQILQSLQGAIDQALAAGAGASGWTDSLITTGILDAITQRDVNRKTVTTVSSVDDLSSLQKWDGRTSRVQDIGIYKYNAVSDQWLKDIISERQIITVFSFTEMDNLANWHNRTVYLTGVGMYRYNQPSAKWIKTASISKRTSEYNIVASSTSDDNTAQIYELLEEDTIFVIDTTVCLNTPLLIDKTLTFVCEGQGMILIGDQMTEKEAINVQAPLTKLHDLRCDNPLKLKSATGGKQTCVSIQADNVTVSKSVFYRMLHSCAVKPRSVLLKEVQGTKYLDNYAFECIGVGAGDNDDGSNNYGEDRGDAFVCWGAKAMMVGNYAYAGEGEDCRIAFHCEGLGDFVPPENQTKFDNSDYVIANNYAFGSFRRHFVFEAVQRGQMSNLISDGGATWWAFAFPQSHHCTVNNITIRYDRKNSTAGAAWKPVRGAIGLLNDNSGLRFNNVQIIMDDTDDDAFVVRDSATGKHDVQINNINIKGTRLSKGFGFNIIGATKLNVTNFTIDNMIMAFYSFGAESIKIRNGEVTGADYLLNAANSINFNAKDIDNHKGKIIFNNGGTADIQDIRFKEMDGTNFEVYAWKFDKIRIKDCSSDRTGGGLFSIQGNTGVLNGDYALDFRDNENFKTKVQTTTALLGSLTAQVNTNYKGQGKIVFVGTDAYIATGGLASDTWVSMNGKGSISPA